MAGVSRLQYAANIELIRVMCSGRVDLEFIFRAFAKGIDGVFIGGCRLGECNYITHGNHHALNTVHLCKKIMAAVGLDPERLMIEFMSSGEGQTFAEVVNDFCKKITSLGSLGSSEGLDGEEVDARLEELRRLVPYLKITMRDRLSTLLAEDEYASLYPPAEVERLFNQVVSYSIDAGKCQGCMICARKCPVQAISGGKNQAHAIDQDKCIKCGTCLVACPSRFQAVQEMVGPSRMGLLPITPTGKLAQTAEVSNAG